MLKEILLIIFSLFGFFLSFYIWNKSIRKKERLVCIVGKNCENVIQSKYGKTFGVDNTILGMIYSLVIFLIALSQFLFPQLPAVSYFILGKIIFSGCAALFSVYLIFIQLYVIKELCEYCLASAITSLMIFLVIII
ncbi:MAG: vitamin K epoxide reductase family protein [Nanoarchaeota archaeon]